MMRLHVWILMLLCGSLEAMAQVEQKTDSLRVSADSLMLQEAPSGFITPETVERVTRGTHPFQAKDISTLNNLPEMHMQLDLSLRRDLAHWEGGALVGDHGEESLWGTGTVRYSSAYAYQQIGRLTVTGGLTLEKFNFYRNTGNAIGGQLQGTYLINRNISATAFGRLQNVGFFGPQNSTNYLYGGYFSFTTNNDKWGIDLGAQRYFNPVTRQWTTVPIVMPYYKFQGQKLGVDVGGILKSIFLNVGESASPHDIKPMPRQSATMPGPSNTVPRPKVR